VVEYKRKTRPQRICLADGTMKNILIDDSLPVSHLVLNIAEKLGLNFPEEYSLKLEDKWLTYNYTLYQQEVPENAVLKLAKRFFYSDTSVSVDDPVSLHLGYNESKNRVLSGEVPMSREDAATFAALQMQTIHGNFDPSKRSQIK
jgi:hypothetical protein